MQAGRPSAYSPGGSIDTYISRAKAGGRLSALIKNHVFGDNVLIENDGQVP